MSYTCPTCGTNFRHDKLALSRHLEEERRCFVAATQKPNLARDVQGLIIQLQRKWEQGIRLSTTQVEERRARRKTGKTGRFVTKKR